MSNSDDRKIFEEILQSLSEAKEGKLREPNEIENQIINEIFYLMDKAWTTGIYPPYFGLILSAALGKILGEHDDSGKFNETVLKNLLEEYTKTILQNYKIARLQYAARQAKKELKN